MYEVVQRVASNHAEYDNLLTECGNVLRLSKLQDDVQLNQVGAYVFL